MSSLNTAPQNDRDHLLRIGRYYDADAGEQAIKNFLKGVIGGVDDLDNALYYLLNQFTSDDIRQRLKLAAEVHPEEVARRVFAPQAANDEYEIDGEYEEIAKEANEELPKRKLTKFDEAKRALGG